MSCAVMLLVGEAMNYPQALGLQAPTLPGYQHSTLAGQQDAWTRSRSVWSVGVGHGPAAQPAPSPWFHLF